MPHYAGDKNKRLQTGFAGLGQLVEPEFGQYSIFSHDRHDIGGSAKCHQVKVLLQFRFILI